MSGYLGCFATDTFKANVKFIDDYNLITLFCNRGNYSECYPVLEKSDAHHTLCRFIHEVGVPEEMLSDGAKELHLGKWKQKCQQYIISQRLTEPHPPDRQLCHGHTVGNISHV